MLYDPFCPETWSVLSLSLGCFVLNCELFVFNRVSFCLVCFVHVPFCPSTSGYYHLHYPSNPYQDTFTIVDLTLQFYHRLFILQILGNLDDLKSFTSVNELQCILDILFQILTFCNRTQADSYPSPGQFIPVFSMYLT